MTKHTVFNKIGFVLLPVIVVMTTLAYGTVHQGIIGMFYVFLALLVLVWALDCFRRGEIRLPETTLLLPLAAITVYGFLQAVPYGSTEIAGLSDVPLTISLDPNATRLSAFHLLALTLFFAVALVMLDSASRLRKMAIFLTVFGAAYAFYAILQSILSPTAIYGVLERPFASPFGSFVSRNNFAAWMELAIAVPLGLLLTGAIAKDKRLLIGTAAVIMGVSIVASGSRGGLVAMIAQIIFLVFLTVGRAVGSNVWLRVSLAAVLIAAIVAGTAFVGGESSLTRIADEAGRNENISIARPQMWSTTLKMIADNMPFGVGLGAYPVAYTRYDASSGLFRVEQAHNDYLQTLSDAGLPGVVIGAAFLFLLVRTGRGALKTGNTLRRGIAAGAAAGVFGVLVHSIFDFPMHTTAIAVFFMLQTAVLVVTGNEYPDDVADDEEPHRSARRASPREA